MSYRTSDSKSPSVPPCRLDCDKCNVYLYFVNVEAFLVPPLRFLPDAKPSYQHWGVVFSYDDGTAYVCEAKSNVFNGRLEGNMFRKTAAEAERLGRRWVFLGRHEIAVDCLRSIVEGMRRNPKHYTLTRKNCQYWATELLQRLGIQVPLSAFEQTKLGKIANKPLSAALK